MLPYYYYYIIPTLLMLVTLIVSALHWQGQSFTVRLIALHIVLSLIANTVGVLFPWQSTPFFNCYMLADFFVLFFAVYNIFPGKGRRFFYAGASVIFFSAWTMFVLYSNAAHFKNWVLLISHILLSITYLIAIVTGEVSARPLKMILLGILLYSSCSTPIFGMFALIHPGKLAGVFGTVNLALTVLQYLFILYGLALSAKMRTKNQLAGG